MRTARSSSGRTGLHWVPPWEQTPPGDHAPPRLGADTPREQTPPPVDRHTPVNILPCPKLRLRAVKTSLTLTLTSHWQVFTGTVVCLVHYSTHG